MAIRVRCPRCWETAEVAEEHLGRQGKCNSCGAMVQVPSKLTKVCFICGTDVTRGQHAKDADNNYLCLGCFDARNPQQRAVFSVPHLECSACHAVFAQGDGFERAGEPICRDCYHRRVGDDDEDEAPPALRDEPETEPAMPPQPRQRAAEQAEPRVAAADSSDTHITGFEQMSSPRGRTVVRSGSGSLASVLAIMALLAAGGVAYVQFGSKDGAEDELRLRVAVLKAQAEVLTSVGRPVQGLEKYNELLRMVNGKAIQSADLRREIAAAQAAADTIAQSPSDDWEQEHLLKIILLKSQADLLRSLGYAREANERYREIVKLAGGRAVRSALLAEEVRAARNAIDTTVAANPAPRPNPVPPANEQPAAPPANEDPVAADPPVVAAPPDPTPTTPAVVDPPPTTQTPLRPPLKSIFDD